MLKIGLNHVFSDVIYKMTNVTINTVNCGCQ